MSNESESFSNQLMAADNARTKDLVAQELILRELIEKETRFENKLEKLLKFTWSITVICVVVLAACFMILRNEEGRIVEYARTVSLVVGMLGAIGLAVATMSTLSWLFRSRALPLTVIEKRLASLERSLNSFDSDRSARQ